ncbi:MAG: hypothetical protein Tsb0015_12400 [Simkaniaceae bacterium]
MQKTLEIAEEIPAIRPLSFFALEHDIPYMPAAIGRKKFLKKPFLLPSSEILTGEEDFADIAMGWNEEGIYLALEIRQPFEQSNFPAFSKGDALEVFLDTRGQKTRSITKFCHHFVFLPVEVNDIKALEITKFRMEDSHELADPSVLLVETQFAAKSYCMSIHITRDALYGFDPNQSKNLGFTYILHRKEGKPQSFSCAPQEYHVAKHPQLWASCKLLK